MISIDFECTNKHRFEGFFKDHGTYEEQLEKKQVRCPLCDSDDVKRIYKGCSIQARPSVKRKESPNIPNLFETIAKMTNYVTENFEDVGKDFAETARAMHYGVEEMRDVYGESSMDELTELKDEGIDVLPIPDIKKLEN